MKNSRLDLNFLGSIGFFLILAFLLSGCNKFVVRDQNHRDGKLILDDSLQVKQTFTSFYSGLEGIKVLMRPSIPGNGTIVMKLFEIASPEQPLRISSIPINRIRKSKFYTFPFSPIPESNLGEYFIQIQVSGEGEVEIVYANNGNYQEGALYLNDIPQNQQLTFHTVFNRIRVFYTIFLYFLEVSLVIFLAFLLFVFPGWSFLQLFWKPWRSYPFFEKLGLSTGLSLAFYPVLMIWIDLFHFRPGPSFVAIILLFSLLFLLISLFRGKLPRFGSNPGWLRAFLTLEKLQYIDLLALLLVLLIIFSRFWTIRTLSAPLWGDSVSHTHIVQLFWDEGGIFHDWFPYTPYITFTIQFGFSLLSAAWKWLNQADTLSSVLLTGQLINVAAILTIYPLTMKITMGNKMAATIAMLIAGLLSLLPGGYVNWGRYAQLTGLAILPIVLWFLWSVIESPALQPGFSQRMRQVFIPILLASLTSCGMVLSYYRMFFYVVCFVAAMILFLRFPAWKKERRNFTGDLERIVLIGILSLVLIIPWILNLQGGLLANKVETNISTPELTSLMVFHDYLIWKDILSYFPFGLLVLLSVGFILGLISRQWSIVMVIFWYLFITLTFLTQLIRVPAAVFLQNFSVLISLYLPIALVGGWLIARLVTQIMATVTNRSWVSIMLMVLLFLTISFGTFNQSRIADPGFYAMLTRPDQRAMNWINKNLPKSAYFLLEALRLPSGDSIVGTDGGAWLGLLTSRKNTVPPQYALLNEIPEDPKYNAMIVNLVAELENRPIDDPEIQKILCDEGIEYVYIGQRQGKVSFGNTPIFTEEELLASPYYIPIYREDRVSIYKQTPSACK
jgi:hypothetical protein